MYKTVSRITCPPKFRKQCPVDWESLSDLPDSADRWCSICKKQVHRTDDPTKLKQLAQDGKCVAVLYEERMLLGDIICTPGGGSRGHLSDKKLS